MQILQRSHEYVLRQNETGSHFQGPTGLIGDPGGLEKAGALLGVVPLRTSQLIVCHVGMWARCYGIILSL